MRCRFFSAPIAVGSLVVLLAPLGCSQPANPDAAIDGDVSDIGIDASEQDVTITPDTSVADVLRPPMIERTQPESALAAQRRACAFGAGAWPAETLGTEIPVGADIPINHVIVIMQENRSFDHYLGRLVAQGYYQPGDFSAQPDGGVGSGFAHSDQLDGLPPGWTNPDENGNPVPPHLDDSQCYGVNHGWNEMHDQWNNGAMDRFVINNNPNGQRAMYYEDDTVIPFYYALATTFSLGDQYHASVLSSTWPNRYYLMAATSFGIGDNSFCTLDSAAHPVTQIFSQLTAGGHTWMDYTDGPHQVMFFSYFGLRSSTFRHLGTVQCDLMRDIQNGTLPDVSIVMGDEVNGTTDEGPSALAGIGGQWVEGIVRALFQSPSWHDTALFITYDENGGLADHVPPPPACEPDALAPHSGDGTALPGRFDRLGVRVPFIVVSPYARQHFVSHTVYDHTSITRFIEARFGLPAMTHRDANATPPMDVFDFTNPPFMTPPTIGAHTVVPPEVLTRCNQHYGVLGCGTDAGH